MKFDALTSLAVLCFVTVVYAAPPAGHITVDISVSDPWRLPENHKKNSGHNSDNSDNSENHEKKKCASLLCPMSSPLAANRARQTKPMSVGMEGALKRRGKMSVVLKHSHRHRVEQGGIPYSLQHKYVRGAGGAGLEVDERGGSDGCGRNQKLNVVRAAYYIDNLRLR
ncbi:hypothetical protein FB451DRAFT_1369646 [Mycena latifolia]|nr:hypothetical protein FB451DRAFT_1369646 [Mycena latifolia]